MSYTTAKDGKLLCTLCPYNCLIDEGEAGFCSVRRNKHGKLDLPFYGAISSRGVDPVEKKPLYHFLPGSSSYSIGFWGCNMRCPFCQNYSISQQVNVNSFRMSPSETVEAALASGAASISYTYSEPLVHFEYCLDTASLAHAAGLANILVTNGLVNSRPAREIFTAMDACNIDLKSFGSEYYRDELQGDFETVKRSIAIAREETHLELTTLIVPGKNDSPAELAGLIEFIASIDSSIVLHVSRYFPNYKSTVPATDRAFLTDFVSKARQKLDYVYPGNMDGGETDTCCKKCGMTLIRRQGYRTQVLNESPLQCDSCSAKLPYVASIG